MAVRNSISSGHYILSTIHADKAASIPNRMYSLLETNQDIEQFLKSIYRYIQLGVYIRGYQDSKTKSFRREIAEVTEFYVDEDNNAVYNTIFKKSSSGKIIKKAPSKYLIDYLDGQGVALEKDAIIPTKNEENDNLNEEILDDLGNNPVSKKENVEKKDMNTEEVLFMWGSDISCHQ